MILVHCTGVCTCVLLHFRVEVECRAAEAKEREEGLAAAVEEEKAAREQLERELAAVRKTTRGQVRVWGVVGSVRGRQYVVVRRWV